MTTRTKKSKNRVVRNKKTPIVSGWKGTFWGERDWGRLRIYLVGLFFAFLWGLLWVQAFRVQVLDGPALAERAKQQHLITETITGKRGTIFDRNGNVLARSVDCVSVAADPTMVEDAEVAAATVATLLGMPKERVHKLLTGNKRFVWLARKVDDKTALALKQAAVPGITLINEYARIYPYAHLAGQLLGFVGVDGEGLEGLENSFQNVLAGRGVKQAIQRDAVGRRMYLTADKGSVPEYLEGHDLTLTLDVQVQFFAEEALAKAVDDFQAKWGGCIVVDVPTGDVLAWAEYPFFNPNAYRDFAPAARRNKLSMDALEQGSTIKALLIAAALQEGVITPESEFFCERGRWQLRSNIIRDTSVYETLSVNEILRYSSNIGSAKIGLKLGTLAYYNYLSRLGFGQKTNLPLAGESKGILRDPLHWQEVDLANAAFGQSFSATGAQVAQAFLALANDGMKMPLRLVIEEEINEPEEERIFSSDTLRQVRSMMQEVVEAGGTGRRARIPGLAVGGKTGTAQKADSTGTYGAGRVASFVGMVPIDDPRYLVVVIVDEPSVTPYGGVVAAPVFQNVALRTMTYYGHLPEKTAALASNTVAAVPLIPVQVRLPMDAGAVPDVVGMSVRTAVESFASKGIVPVVKGQGEIVVRQEPPAGDVLPVGQDISRCVLWVAEQS